MCDIYFSVNSSNSELNWLDDIGIWITVITAFRLKPNQSLINGLRFPPTCIVSTASVPYPCNCDGSTSGNSFVNCTPPTNPNIFTSDGVSNCFTSTYRRRRDTSSSSSQDDHILAPDFIPSVIVTQSPSRTFTWPTPSGITNATADSACRGKLQSLNIYRQCATYVDVEKIITSCVMDVAVREC